MEPTTLTSDGLAALRRAAVMAHTVGSISLRVTAGDEHVVDVRPDPAAGPPGRRALDPCAFRMAIARAWADHGLGRELGVVDGASRLDIGWSVAAPGRELGLGAVRALCAGRVVWAFASLLDPADLAAVLAAVDTRTHEAGCPIGEDTSARLVHDDLLGATVVHVEARPPVSTRVLDEVLRRMVAVVGAAEVTSAV